MRKNNQVAIIGDGQVTLGSTVAKECSQKVKKIGDNIILGFAGSASDALYLYDQIEILLKKYSGQLRRSAIELIKQFRNGQNKQLEATLLISDFDSTFSISGDGTILEHTENATAIGSGGAYAYCM